MEAFHPANTAEVAALLSEGRPVEVLGRGSKRSLGHPVRADRELHLSRLDKLHFYEPAEMVISVGSGMPLTALENTLAERRQRLAFAPPKWNRLYDREEEAEQSIGGILATNLSGSARLSAGAARDHLIGFTAVNGNGEVFKSGGRVVKNVTGYDLCKLMAGSFGTLAVLCEVTLRVLPMPQCEATLVFQGDAEAATIAFSVARAGPFEVVASAWLPEALSRPMGFEGAVGLLRLEGIEASVQERCTRLSKQLRGSVATIEGEGSKSLWRALGDGLPLGGEHGSAIWRMSVPPAAGVKLLNAFPQDRGWLDWAGGLVWLSVRDEGDASALRVRTMVSEYGGHATLIRASEGTRQKVPVFQPQSHALSALNARVKSSFDPTGILNPGRVG